MSPRLIPRGSELVNPIELNRPVILIGRNPDADVVIRHPKISRIHCCVVQVDKRWVIRDLKSTTGVRINGYQIHESDLKPNDEVGIGPLIFQLEWSDVIKK